MEPLRPTSYPQDDVMVWAIHRTGEFFLSYDEYLTRLDFYLQKKFICELTGHSCLTYFQALDSEAVEAEKIVKNFPEVLKEPILRKVQFSTTGRLDGLVDEVYNRFKHEFFPGEVVVAKVNDQRVSVTVREKAKFNSIALPSGEVRPGYCRCRVETAKGEELVVDESDLTRDRKYFTKVILKTFLKYCIQRESWAGAPWLVKDEYANMYRIEQEIPSHLKRPTQSPDKAKLLKQEKREQVRMEKLRLKLEAKRIKLEKKLLKKEQVIKEDLLFPISNMRPQLKYFKDDININTVLETFMFLNIYGKPLELSAFKFDDYVQVLRLDDVDSGCLIMNEIHCALLLALEDSIENLSLEPSPANSKKNNWRDRLKKRLFRDGGWQLIVIGLFQELEMENYQDEIEDILAIMAPTDPVLLHVAYKNYMLKLSPNKRLLIIKILIELLHKSPVIRGFIDIHSELPKRGRKENKVNCQRAKIIGVDRFYNKYWWFEKNEDFVMSRLWVQGPTVEELKYFLGMDDGFPKMTKDDVGNIINKDGKILLDKDGNLQPDITGVERKFIEEYPSPLKSSEEWGFYDDPEQIDNLLTWLNPYGKRESKLVHEINAVKDQLVDSVTKRQTENQEIEKSALENEDIIQLNSDISLYKSELSGLNGDENGRRKRKREDLENRIEEKERERNDLEKEVRLESMFEWENQEALEKHGSELYDLGRRRTRSKK